MKTIQIMLLSLVFFNISVGQEKFLAKQGYVEFYSSSPVEDITANNNQALSIIDKSTGEIVVSILMKSFIFEGALMQEHFNENYVESDKFPKATFKGKMLNFNKDAQDQTIDIDGDLTMHGVTKKCQFKAKMKNTNSNIKLNGDFTILVADYNITIPKIVENNIAKTIKITFAFDYTPSK